MSGPTTSQTCVRYDTSPVILYPVFCPNCVSQCSSLTCLFGQARPSGWWGLSCWALALSPALVGSHGHPEWEESENRLQRVNMDLFWGEGYRHPSSIFELLLVTAIGDSITTVTTCQCLWLSSPHRYNCTFRKILVLPIFQPSCPVITALQMALQQAAADSWVRTRRRILGTITTPRKAIVTVELFCANKYHHHCCHLHHHHHHIQNNEGICLTVLGSQTVVFRSTLYRCRNCLNVWRIGYPSFRILMVSIIPEYRSWRMHRSLSKHWGRQRHS